MEEIIDTYNVSAKSKDGQTYTLELVSKENKLQEALNTHLHQKGWEHYGYVITQWDKVNKHEKID